MPSLLSGWSLLNTVPSLEELCLRWLTGCHSDVQSKMPVSMLPGTYLRHPLGVLRPSSLPSSRHILLTVYVLVTAAT